VSLFKDGQNNQPNSGQATEWFITFAPILFCLCLCFLCQKPVQDAQAAIEQKWLDALLGKLLPKTHVTWLKFSAQVSGTRNLARLPCALVPNHWYHWDQRKLLITVVLINSNWSPQLESHFNAGLVAFWPSKWTNKIVEAICLLPVSGVWYAQLGHKFTWAKNLGHVPSA